MHHHQTCENKLYHRPRIGPMMEGNMCHTTRRNAKTAVGKLAHTLHPIASEIVFRFGHHLK